jgi:type IV secretory pathway VirB10-like protein
MFTLNLTGPSHVNRAASPVYRRRPLDSSDSDDDTKPAVNTFGMLTDYTPPLPHWMRQQQDSITEQPISPTVVPIATLQHHSTESEEDDDEPSRRKRQMKTTSRRRKRARAAAQFFDLEAGVDGDASADEEDDQPNQADLDFIAPDNCFD